jgi:hypothetical protein
MKFSIKKKENEIEILNNKKDFINKEIMQER